MLLNPAIIPRLLKLRSTIHKSLFQGYLHLTGSTVFNDSRDYVSSLDHQISHLLKQTILTQFPEVGLESEESSDNINDQNRIVLRVDPVDGTKHLMAGIPLFSCNLSLIVNDSIHFAMIVDGYGDDTYHAIRGQGAYKNNRPIHVNSHDVHQSFILCEAPSAAIFSQHPTIFQEGWNKITALQQHVFRTRNIGLGGLSICLVASGAACGYIDLSGTTKLVDVEAPLFIAKEAKAVISNLEGQTIDPNKLMRDNHAKKYLTESLIVGNLTSAKTLVKLMQSSKE